MVRLAKLLKGKNTGDGMVSQDHNLDADLQLPDPDDPEPVATNIFQEYLQRHQIPEMFNVTSKQKLLCNVIKDRPEDP